MSQALGVRGFFGWLAGIGIESGVAEAWSGASSRSRAAIRRATSEMPMRTASFDDNDITVVMSRSLNLYKFGRSPNLGKIGSFPKF